MSTKRTKKSLLDEIDELRKIRDDLMLERTGLKNRVELLEKENNDHGVQLRSLQKSYSDLLFERELLAVQVQKAKNLAHALVEEGSRLVWSQKKKED
jgi:chromosome segregation ATPase